MVLTSEVHGWIVCLLLIYSRSGKARFSVSYELKSARFLARDVLIRAVHPGDTVIDATMGNGHDTQFLCNAVGPDGRVYAFDIQKNAVSATETLLRNNGLSDRAVLFQTGCRSGE